MSFNTALSGLNAASSELNVVSNNVANSSTVGFKGSRAEFADVYATSALGSSSTAVGSGVLLSEVAQQFKQGNMEFTESTLDLAVSGEGFFIMHENQNTQAASYTRAGAMQLNADGFVVNANGSYLQALPVNPDGTVTSTSLSSTINLELPQTAGSPAATTEIEIGANFQADATALPVNSFDTTNATSYNSSTSLTVYDSLGNSHITTFYFVKDNAANAVQAELNAELVAASHAGYSVADSNLIGAELTSGANITSVADLTAYLTNGTFGGAAALSTAPGPNGTTPNGNLTPAEGAQAIWDSHTGTSTWAVFTYMDDGSGTQQGVDSTGGIAFGGTSGAPDYALVTFDASGTFRAQQPNPTALAAVTPTSGANDISVSLDFASNTPTQFATPFNVTTLAQDGYTAGRLTGIDISDTGVVRANYSNGTQNALGKIALANFSNNQGLKQMGNTTWEESLDSGPALVGEAGTGSFGNIRSGALESSNVDLTAELVKLITAQRNFQANAKAIETASAVTQTVIQMR